jgi:undecaprenyl-diphosphatase
MDFLEILKVIFLGIVEGITEWLPISSTGHMILVDEFIKLDVSPAFMEMFLVVIQLGAIMAVVILYWNKLFPFSFKKGEQFIKKDTMIMWVKLAISCVPAGIVGVVWGDEFDALFYNYISVSIALIVFGVLFIIIERYNKGRRPQINSIAEITIQSAVLIGFFQLIAAIFPGTSRSGATIVGALLLGISRTVAAEYTFFLAVPVMFGASLLKLVKFGFNFSGNEFLILILGMLSAFIVSIIVIKFLMGYIKKNDFTAFGIYRIILGALVIIYYLAAAA